MLIIGIRCRFKKKISGACNHFDEFSLLCVSEPVANNDPWSPMPSIAGPGQASSQSDAWPSPIAGGHATSNNEAASIDPFSPVAQKELSDFDLLRNEIESTNISNIGGENNIFIIRFSTRRC